MPVTTFACNSVHFERKKQNSRRSVSFEFVLTLAAARDVGIRSRKRIHGQATVWPLDSVQGNCISAKNKNNVLLKIGAKQQYPMAMA